MPPHHQKRKCAYKAKFALPDHVKTLAVAPLTGKTQSDAGYSAEASAGFVRALSAAGQHGKRFALCEDGQVRRAVRVLGISGPIDSDAAARIGKAASADAVIHGTLSTTSRQGTDSPLPGSAHRKLYALVNIDLVITDLIMPGMNGKELAKKIDEISDSIKVIFTSGYTEEYITDNDIISQEDNFLQKPFTINMIAQKVRETIDFE